MQEILKIIEKGLQSENMEDCAYAIRACYIHHISDKKIISLLEKLKSNNRVVMMHKISDMAIATLDLLKVEKYSGDNPTIIEIINTSFYNE